MGSGEASVSASLGAVPAASGTRRPRGRTRSAAYSFSPLRPGARPTAVKPHGGSCPRAVAVTADARTGEVLRERPAHWPDPDPGRRGTGHHADDPIAAAQDADLLLHLTEWPAHRHIGPVRLASRVVNPKVIDARGTLTADDWRGAGWIYRVLGRP
ncbi:hypothetical protein [Streptomyces eurythermus]|uniref:hypothetical protein n=1 Tax=Streptomyces eurythermus TaxID=42237 RepID=UPI0036FE27F5